MTTSSKEFKGAAVQTTTTGSINGSDTDVSIASASGWPTGAANFTMVLDRGTASEEKILCSSRTGTSIHMIERGYDNTAATSHASGATAEHCLAADDLAQLNNHATNASNDDHTQYYNQSRGDARYIKVADKPTITSATVATNESTTSATFTDLATAGPAVTVTVPASGVVKVTVSANISYNPAATYALMGFALSGANTVAASDAKVLSCGNGVADAAQFCSNTFYLSGLTAGSTTFTAKYHRTFGTTATFINRSIIVETYP